LKTKTEQYDILSITIQQIIKAEFDLHIDDETLYIIQQQDSPLFNQIELIRGYPSLKIKELIYVEATHSKNRKPKLEKLLKDGFKYNDIQYVRFGKSGSQAKDGITVFIDKDFYDEMMERSQLGVTVEKCVVSKYESYRCLIFSTCQLVQEEKMPNIVLVGEYTKVLEDQYVRYAVEKDVEYYDKKTEQNKIYKNKRMIEEGKYNVDLSPFDGFGVHTPEMSEIFAKYMGKDHVSIGYQIRLPFLKGMSIQAPIKEFYADKGITEIKDIFGVVHKISDIDCIWNVSMWKAFGIFQKEFGNKAWDEYLLRVNKYGYKIGISKYSHHINDLNLYTRMNFQYVQCLDLINPKYVKQFKDGDNKYNILDKDNWGKIINIAKYSTDLYEKIIKGDKFYTLKFLGINDTEIDKVNSTYIEAILANDIMLKDPCIKNMLKRKLEKAITQMKYGKVYAEGFYHTVIGDIVGYLEYCAEIDIKGCLKAGEFHCNTIPYGDALSFRSPLVDPSEVNKVKIVKNELIDKYFGYFKDQDIVMINMYDLSMPQQGGMDDDGDSVYLSHNRYILESKINSPIVVDIDDKKSSGPVDYNQENIIIYECNSRDNRIGEITNIATSILNQYTEDKKWQQINADNISLLRLYQGKEIDFIKNGFRWIISKNLRQYLKRLPYFLLFNYPKKLDVYNKIREINKGNDNDDKIPYNAYKSPSPLNELSEYIYQWEKHNIIWDRSVINSGDLLINQSLDLSNKHIMKKIRNIYDEFKIDFQKVVEEEGKLNVILGKYKTNLAEIKLDKETLANYCIKVAYRTISEDKLLCWSLFGNYMVKNLKNNSIVHKQYKIEEVKKGKIGSYEFLGKYFELQEVVDVFKSNDGRL